MGDVGPAVAQHDRDHVEADGCIYRRSSPQPGGRKRPQSRLLPVVYRLTRQAPSVAASRLHLAEDDLPVSLRNYVYLALLAAEISVDDPVALFLKTARRELLADVAQSPSLVHGREVSCGV